MYENKKTFESILVLIVDLCSLIVSMGLAFWLRYGIFYGRFEHGDQIWLLVFAVALYGLMFVMMDFSHHFFRRGMFDEFVSVVKSEVIFSAVLILALFVMHRSADLSRRVFGYQIVINTVVMYAARVIFKQYMVKVYRNSRHSNRLLVVTSSDQAENVLENLKEYNEWNRTIAGLVLTDAAQVSEINEIPVVAHSEDFLNYVIRNDVDEVFIIDDKMMRTPLMDEWVRELEQMGIIVDVNIDAFDLSISGKKTLNRVGKYAVVSFGEKSILDETDDREESTGYRGSLVGMVILGIATIFVAPAIKLDSPGPVFFGQTRVGKNGRKFTFYKFRSMYKDAEARKKELMASNEVKGLMFKMEDDPRITKVGKFIRKTSIDELPQFWNVLRGDMSLVGTRPPTVDEFEHYEAKHKCRLSMTPGLTGLWQISGRSDIRDFDEVVRLDMQYIDNWSILKDIKILILTVKVVLTGRGSR